MELLVLRHDNEGDACSADLYVDGVLECYTLEDLVRAGPKVYGRTAIPEGRYKLALVKSPHFGDDTLAVLNVPGYDDIRIHGGNKPEDTLGCLLVGASIMHTPA